MGLGSALRQSVRDFYFNSWRLAPANLVWGIGFVGVLLAGPLTVLGIVLLLLLAVPLAGLHRMAALIARGEPAAFGDFVDGMRRFGGPAVLIAAGAAGLAIVFTTNVIVGFETGGPVAWFVSAMALWGDVALAMFLVVIWPILVDPQREGLGMRRRLGLAGVMVIGRPGRVLVLTVLVALILLVSTVLFAAILLVSVAYVSLVSNRYLLPMLDALETRLSEARHSEDRQPEARLPG
jgi:hypothetical protein